MRPPPCLRALTGCSGVFSTGIALVMLLSLTVVHSRIQQGSAIFG